MTDQFFLYLMSLFYLAAGINHFVNPKWYVRIIPPWLPYPEALNYISGACEIVFAVMLIPIATRSIAAWLIVAMLVAIFPANIQMCINFWRRKNSYFWLTVLRLPLQIPLIWWALQYTGE